MTNPKTGQLVVDLTYQKEAFAIGLTKSKFFYILDIRNRHITEYNSSSLPSKRVLRILHTPDLKQGVLI